MGLCRSTSAIEDFHEMNILAVPLHAAVREAAAGAPWEVLPAPAGTCTDKVKRRTLILLKLADIGASACHSIHLVTMFGGQTSIYEYGHCIYLQWRGACQVLKCSYSSYTCVHLKMHMI